MAAITLKDLPINSGNKADLLSNSGSFIQDLSEEQISLRGGMCVAYDGESSGGCSDVIINFPEKFDLIKFIPKRK